ncbi:hypothetical protein BKA61DRAFT_675536 [Leptodontidium sp. MPI-SDFR-AT-0119]|nr:hypothetical protein BKA61DRAFT_675536 [Leptodontidium sp. MPI-SDFR-AT-0119]
MGIFDMTNLTWGFDYNPDATPYARSNVVKDYHTSAKSPFPGTWSNTTLCSSNWNSFARWSSSASHDSNTGAIVGGAVGVVVSIASILLGIVFWRKHKAAKLNVMPAAPGPEPDMLVYQPHFEVDAEHRRFEMGFGMIPEMDEQRAVLEMDGLKKEEGVERRMTEGSGSDTTT